MGVGKQLRLARETRGLTVRDVAELTKIPSRQIDAIEAERYEKLPAGIFGRGYVRAVAAAVKLDPDAILRAYQDETEGDHSGTADRTVSPRSGAAPHGRSTPVPPPWRVDRLEPRMRLASPEREGKWPRPGLLAAVLIGIGVILLIIWLGRDRGIAPTSRKPAQTAQRVGRPPVAGETPAPQPVGTIGRQQRSASSVAPAGGGATQVHLQAVRACWVVLTVDGDRVVYRILQPGETVRATMRSSGTLRTGDAGALTLAIGREAPKPVGPPGAVRTIQLHPPAR